MMTFDENGHIYSYEVIELSLQEFQRVFVKELENRDYREGQFTGYLAFVNEIKKTLKIPFFQWIDGSYTTQKPFPADVDVVSFID